MNIILVSMQRILETMGGIESYTLDLCKALAGRGERAVILSRSSRGVLPIDVSTCENAHSEVVRNEAAAATESLPGPTVLYLFQLAAFTFLAVLYLVKRFKKKDLDIMHAQDPYFAGLAVGLVHALLGRPAIVHVHGHFGLPINIRDVSLYWLVHRVVFKMTLKLGTTILTTDPVTAGILITQGAKSSKVEIMPNFVDETFFLPRPQKEKETGNLVSLGFVGRLDRIKRIDMLLMATAHLKGLGYSVRTIIVGDGNEKQKLLRLCGKLALDGDVNFVGRSNEVCYWLQRMDVFVLPSESEGAPMAVLEAMAAGLPLVVSDLPSLRWLIGSDGASFFQRGNLKSLNETLENLITSPSMRKELTSQSTNHSRCFSTDAVVKRIISKYRAEVVRCY